MDAAGPAEVLEIVQPRGSRVSYARFLHGRRRLAERDREGRLLAELGWGHDGALRRAALRIPDGSWIEVEPRAAIDARWGMSDRVWHAGTPLTLFAAVDWARIDTVPPLAEPAKLPPGAGTAILNLIAALAADQDRSRLAYRGPYPTEHLFLALLESFRYVPAGPDPLAAFMANALDWSPAPHERLLSPEGVWVQLRDRVEKVAWQGRMYYRPLWQGVARRSPRRVRDTGGGVTCSLWLLDTAVEDHLRLGVDGSLVEVLAVPPPDAAVTPLPASLVSGLGTVVASGCVPILAPFVAEAVRELTLEWGPVDRDLVGVDGRRVRLSNRVPPIAGARLAAAPGREARARLALTLLVELADLVGDDLRRRAQAAVAALPETEQERLLHEPPLPRPAAAHEIVPAMDSLLALAVRTSRGE